MPKLAATVSPGITITLIPQKIQISETTGKIRTTINPNEIKNLYFTSTHLTDDAKFNLYYERIDVSTGELHILKNHVMAPGTTLVFKGSEILFDNDKWELKIVMSTGSLDIVGI